MSWTAGAYEFGPFRLDSVKRVLWRSEEVVALPPKALDVLLALVEQHGDVVRKQELMERVWPDTFVEEANLSVNISALRKVLGEQEDGRPYIQTIPRRGYRFLAQPRRAQGRGEPPSLAVLPFEPLGAQGDDEYLGLGMADALITRLGSLGQIVVRPTSAVLKYAGRRGDPREAGRELKVDAVLSGTIQRQAARLRLTVQLVPVTGSATIWAEAFEEELTHIFAVQDKVAERLAQALALRLGGAEKSLLAKRHTQDVEAYQAYLKGRYFWSRLTGPSIEKAFGCFQEAVERDPAYALPHAGLADGYVILGFSGLVPPRDAWSMAASEARRALELDETVAEAHISLAYVSVFQDWDWKGAEKGLTRALALSPHSPAAHQWYGLYLDMLGRFDEARREVARALELDPLSLIVSNLMSFQFSLAREHERELTQCRNTVELEPNQFLGHWSLGLAYQHNGLHAEAVAAHRQALDLSGGSAFVKAVLARSLVLAGRGDEARALLAELESSEAGYASPYQRATIRAALAERDEALRCLERACEERDPWLVWIKVDPMLDALRTEERFGGLLERVFPGGR